MIGVTFRRLWTLLTLKHAVFLWLCLYGFWVHVIYRVPGRALFLLLPALGLALAVLSLVVLVNHLLGRGRNDDPYRRVFRAVDRGATAIVLIFLALSTFVFLNGFLDRSPAVERTSEVVVMDRGEVDLGWRVGYGWAGLGSWHTPGGLERLLLWDAEHDRLWVGQAVIARTRRGAFGVEWVERVERDEESHNRRILAVAPTASRAWKGLVRFYLDRLRWQEALAAARDYLALYPNDLDFAMDAAGVFGQARRHADVVALLEPFIERRPNYLLYNYVGFALGYLGKKREAVALLRIRSRSSPTTSGPTTTSGTCTRTRATPPKRWRCSRKSSSCARTFRRSKSSFVNCGRASARSASLRGGRF